MPDLLRPFILRFLKLRLWLLEKVRPSELWITLAWAGLVGFLGGMASVLFRDAIDLLQGLLAGHGASLIEIAQEAIPWWKRLIIPTAGGLAAGAVLHYGTRLLKYRSSTDYMEAISIGDGVVRARSTLLKSLSSLFTIASGGSIGREGPMVQLASMIASALGRWRNFTVPRRQLLVACGAAAGIASAYNAPIGGSLFVAEIVLGSIATESLGPLVFSSVIATVTVHQVFHGKPVFVVPVFELVSNFELLPYILLGAAAGFLAPAFLSLLEASERAFGSLRVPATLRLACGGLVVGALSIFSTGVWGNGYDVVNEILHFDLLWQAVLLVLVLKVAATAATVGSGAVGGVFTPTLFVGAALGFLAGYPVHALWPDATATPNAYALVGMGCFLAATTHAPLMAIIILSEMTLDYAIVLPLMLGCVTASFVSQGIRPKSIYADVLRRKKAEGRKDSALSAAPTAALRVRDLLKPSPLCVSEKAHFGDVARTFAGNRYNYLYVTDALNRFRGAISLHDIKTYLNHPDLAELAIAIDFMRDDFPLLTPDLPLAEALAKFSGHDGERLPVVASAGDPVLLGTLSKTDLLLTLAHPPEWNGEERRGRPETA